MKQEYIEQNFLTKIIRNISYYIEGFITTLINDKNFYRCGYSPINIFNYHFRCKDSVKSLALSLMCATHDRLCADPEENALFDFKIRHNFWSDISETGEPLNIISKELAKCGIIFNVIENGSIVFKTKTMTETYIFDTSVYNDPCIVGEKLLKYELINYTSMGLILEENLTSPSSFLKFMIQGSNEIKLFLRDAYNNANKIKDFNNSSINWNIEQTDLINVWRLSIGRDIITVDINASRLNMYGEEVDD